jgi:ABC-2 type transport system ATP-binding protein
LDPVVRDDFLRGLIETSAQGEWTILISSHDIEDIERLADWIGFIENGRLHFAEELESLQRRFRRMEITRGADTTPPGGGQRPASWLNYEEAGTMVRYIETSYQPQETEKQCGEIFHGATATASPLPLREIYVTLARASRAKAAEPFRP